MGIHICRSNKPEEHFSMESLMFLLVFQRAKQIIDTFINFLRFDDILNQCFFYKKYSVFSFGGKKRFVLSLICNKLKATFCA